MSVSVPDIFLSQMVDGCNDDTVCSSTADELSSVGILKN